MTNDEIRDEFPSRRFYFEDSGQGLVQKQLRMVRHPHPGPTGIELRELRQVRSADFSPLPAVLVGRERGGLKSALLNSMAVGPRKGAAPSFLKRKACVVQRLGVDVLMLRRDKAFGSTPSLRRFVALWLLLFVGSAAAADLEQCRKMFLSGDYTNCIRAA